MVELWDAYKPDGTITKKTLIRGEKIPEGLCHAVSEVFVMHEDGSVLLMQRDKQKRCYPGCWESGAGGAVLKGEDFEHGARRELLEETGIRADKLQLIYESITQNTIFKGYLCITSVAKDSIRLQEGETINYRWVDQGSFKKFYESEQFVGSLRDRLREFVMNYMV